MTLRKLICATAVLLTAICGTGGAAAQQTVGQWNVYPLFDSSITNCVETDSKVFYVSANRLFSFDKDGNETYIYSIRNVLNDTEVNNIYYNPEKDYLLVTYSTGNIDMLYVDDNRVVNLGDITAATISATKAINDVAFRDGKIYVATDFGVVVFDDTKHQVDQSGIFNSKVTGIATTDKYLVIAINEPVQTWTTNRLYTIPLGSRVNDLNKFTSSNETMSCTSMVSFADRVWVKAENGTIYEVAVNPETGALTRKTLADRYLQRKPQSLKGGGYLAQCRNSTTSPGTQATLVTYDNNAAETAAFDLPEQFLSQTVASLDPTNSIWAVDGDGLANYKVDNGEVTVLSDKVRPEASTVDRVAYIVGSKNGERIYISNLGCTMYKSINPSIENYEMQRTDVLIDGVPHDAAVFDAQPTQPDCKTWQKQNNSTRMFGGCQRLAVDPNNPDRYFIGNTIDGVYVIENNEKVGHFTINNMPMQCFWGGNKYGACAYDVNFDPKGNLWVGCWLLNADYSVYSPYVVLPAEKLKGDLSAITKDDWQKSAHLNIDNGEKDMGSIFSTTSNMMFTWKGSDSNPLGVTDTKGTYSNTSDDVFMEFINVTDQDGNVFSPVFWICAAEDKRGRMWFGTTNGIVEITRPASCFDASFTFTRPKVPRNDGTPYADYLLESDQINCIAVDASNRKWIATENSGVYLVSENGDAIIEHFTSENSDLPSNTVYSVYTDPNSNVVYFGLKTGLVTYNSTSSPASENYDDVYAYPNPVRPDYTGWITIKGLMDNSLVKIADAAGNVFFQTRSEGGMVVWDGCNSAGERVKSGVYFVFASQNENDNASGAVTKIMVIK